MTTRTKNFRIRLGQVVEYRIPGDMRSSAFGRIKKIERENPKRAWTWIQMKSTTRCSHDILVTVKSEGREQWISPKHIVKVIG
jgi:hypothetical protein